MSFGRNGADVTEAAEEIEETTAIIYQGCHFALLLQNVVPYQMPICSQA